MADGSYHMFYAVEIAPGASAIGEAHSLDGLSWERVGQVLAPTGPSADPLRPNIDALSAGAPCAVLGTSSTGRAIEYLYYAAVDEQQNRSIALAARYDAQGAFSRAASPVYANAQQPTEPWVMRYPSFTLLFATQKAGSTTALDYPAVAAGVAPATVTLPPPEPR
jgi:hypothetical protein